MIKKICLQRRRPRFSPWVRKIPWRRKWQPTPVFLPGKSHEQRNLVDYSPWDYKQSEVTEPFTFSLSWVSRTLNTVSEPEYLQLISASKGGLMNTGQVREQSLDSWLLFLWTELKKGFSHDGEKRAIPQHLPVFRVTNHFSFSRMPFNLAPKALHPMKPINVRETGMVGYPKRAIVWPPWGIGYWNWINRTATS